MKIRLLLGVFALIVTCAPAPAAAQAGNCAQTDSSTRPDCPGAIAFFRRFQSALRKNDRQAVASLIAYPVLTSLHHKSIRIRNRTKLLAHFDEVFDEGVRCTILSATDKDGGGSWRGFSGDAGAVWFDSVIPPGDHPDTNEPDYWTKYPFKIITINNDGQYACKTP